MADDERLKADKQRLEELCRKSSLIKIIRASPLMNEYEVAFYCTGIILEDETPVPKEEHKVRITLKEKYPHKEPPKLECLNPIIFHPNVNSETGDICIQGGKWDPTWHLDDVCIQVGRMIQYKNFNVTNCWNKDAAIYAIANWKKLNGLDPRPIDKGEPVSSEKDQV